MKSFLQPIAALIFSAALVSAAPTLSTNEVEKRFVGGQCGIHVTQHQKNEEGVGNDYQFDVRIFDGIQEIIGGTNGLDIPNLTAKDVSSQLPYQLVITAGEIDVDPVAFAYAGQTWTSQSGCKTGGYDSGSRQMDCGFSC